MLIFVDLLLCIAMLLVTYRMFIEGTDATGILLRLKNGEFDEFNFADSSYISYQVYRLQWAMWVSSKPLLAMALLVVLTFLAKIDLLLSAATLLTHMGFAIHLGRSARRVVRLAVTSSRNHLLGVVFAPRHS